MIKPRWRGCRCVIAATGPSMTYEVAERCRIAHQNGTHRVAAVSDAYRLLPFADMLYAADRTWWTVHRGCPEFTGEKWTSRQEGQPRDERFGLKTVLVRHRPEFSLNRNEVHGFNSGAQLLNLVMLLGANPIILVGYNMQAVNGKRHFFGDHPKPLDNSSRYEGWLPSLEHAARSLPKDIKIVNATPDSAIKCFDVMPLAEALAL